MATPEAVEFAALLKELKDRSGRSYGVLAGRLHVSTSTLHRYCNGDAVPNEYAPVERLARLCGATGDELVELHRRWIVAEAARRRGAAKPEAGAKSAPEPPARAVERERPARAVEPVAVPEPPLLSDSVAQSDVPADVPTDAPADEPVGVPAAVSAAGHTAAVPVDLLAGGPADPAAPRRAGRFASRRLRVLLAATAVVALAVSGALVASALSGKPSDDGRTDAADKVRSSADAVTPTPRPDTSASAKTGTPKPSGTADQGSPSATPSATVRRSARPGAPVGSGVPVTATISSYNYDAPCGQYYLLDQQPDDVPPPPPPQDTRSWAKALGGVDGGGMRLELTLQGTSKEAVVLQGLHVRVLARDAPLPWSAYSMGEGCGSGITPQSFDVDLDDGRPRSKPVAGQQGDTVVPATDFPYRVSSTDVEVFNIDAHVEGHDVTWYLELEWSSGGRSGTLRIDDRGKPFRTSGIRTRPEYRYWHDKAQWVKHEY
ncbi:helix-turn-helix domain-containing protein [Streptomyces sp. NBC_00654]|uniref:helix-turn-helix domain-containing protein n=1 Tax=Streptomyces sp. NBC_00654 TaxID=2975799 RepID=UPI00224E244D|nr:transcriptional regulator [Streptomyces sp. NBC_00654]MCX4963974.1 helix-turn-helix domain-containing protein [Streptomyces sp. NBC_00654]